ncbi:hypothetical protein [Sulfurovum sp. bin170]|nr:hypothetical protein [Sulfurovum sp. bin170]
MNLLTINIMYPIVLQVRLEPTDLLVQALPHCLESSEFYLFLK